MLILATVVAMDKYVNESLEPHWNDGFVGLTRDEIIERIVFVCSYAYSRD